LLPFPLFFLPSFGETGFSGDLFFLGLFDLKSALESLPFLFFAEPFGDGTI
jgi:hypothetical protein